MRTALAFLIVRTVRNRLLRQAARVKRPRYAIASLLGIGYVALIFLGPVFAGSGNPMAPTPGGTSAPGSGSMFLSFIVVSFSVTLFLWWLRGGVSGSLAFQPAEVHFLFPGPIPRRSLIGYKIVRSQLLILINAFFWMFFVRRWAAELSAPMRFASAWGFFSLLSLHRLGAALVQTPPVQRGRRIAFLIARAAAAVAIVALVVGALPALAQLGRLGFARGLTALAGALAAPPASYATVPVRFMLAPLMAHTPQAWLTSFALVTAAIALHMLWVLSINVEFEETAASASVELARRVAALRERAAGGVAAVGPTKATRTWLPLAPLGRAAVAIVWKNTLALTRTSNVRSIVVLVLTVILISTMTSSVSGREGTGTTVVIPFLAMTLVMGPRILRNDLRQDLLSLSLLKTYPLRGFDVVLAEMASPALVLTLAQWLMLLVAAMTLPSTIQARLSQTQTVAAVLVAPLVFLAINGMSIAIQNGAALMFPGWVRLGRDSGGLEAVGQNLLLTFGAMLALALALVPAGLEGLLVFTLTRRFLGELAIPMAIIAGSVMLLLEIAWMVGRLGRMFEKTEPNAII